MQFPKICELDAETVMQEIRKKAPFYVPEWNVENEEDFGIVLSNIFSRMVDLVSSKLNEAPKKHFLSFLEIINTSLIPASPARAPLTFVLSEGAPDSVLIEAHTQVSAGGPNGNKVIFETEKGIHVTPSKLVSVYSVIKETDKIINNTVAIDGVQSTELFAGDSLQKHILYIGDERLFNVQQGQISIEFELEEKLITELADQKNVEWKYSVESSDEEDGKEVKKIYWQPLKTKLEGKILTLNTENKPIDKVKLNEIETRWLKCQLKDSKIKDFKNLSIKTLTTSSSSTGIPAEYLFSNDIPINPNSNFFYPFGRKPYLYDTFYITSKEAFSKKGYKVTLQFDLKPGSSNNELDKPQLSWEYWDGESWNLLHIKGNDEWDINLSIESKGSDEQNCILTIAGMPEVKLTRVNGKENYWIRVRLTGGNYGKEYEIVSSSKSMSSVDNNTSNGEIIASSFNPPQIKNLKICFDIKTDKQTNSSEANNDANQLKRPEYICAENNLIFRNCLEKLDKNEFFKPFEPLPDVSPAVYFGFDKELDKGPFSLFVNVDESIEHPETFRPKVKWQYLIKVNRESEELEVLDETAGCTKKNPEVWEELEVLDETAGFTKKGMVQFNISGKMKASELFGSDDKFWIRAVITENFSDADTSIDSVNQTLISQYQEKLKEQKMKDSKSFQPEIKWQYSAKEDTEKWEEFKVLNETSFAKKSLIKFDLTKKKQTQELGLGDQYWIKAVLTEEDFFTNTHGDTINQLLASMNPEKPAEQGQAVNEKLKEKKIFKQLFEPLPGVAFAVYFGFNKGLIKNRSICFLITVDENIEYPGSFIPKIQWQYLAKEGSEEEWKELEVTDKTESLIKSGEVRFNIPKNMQASGYYGLGNQYWIRAVQMEATLPFTSSDFLNQVLTSLSMDQLLTSLKVGDGQLRIQQVIISSRFTDNLLNKVQDFFESDEYVKYLSKFRPAIYTELENLNEKIQLARSGLESFQMETAKIDKIKTNSSPDMPKKDPETCVSKNSVSKKCFEIFNINLCQEDGRRFPPKVRGFYLNSVWGIQSRTIYDEVIGSGTGKVNTKFKLVHTPVISEEIWVNEVTTLPEKERKILLSETNNVKLKQDDKGNITEFWVRWSQVDDFLSSKSKHRHYTIDKIDGEVRFGNGKYGMIPPIGSNNIKATYSTGGGNSGNVDASKISKLQSSIAYVDKVFNPISSSGGTETEDVDAFIKRAPAILKNRNRAVAVEDYEWLAKESSDSVARAKAIPNFDSQGNPKTGWVTVIIVPESSSSKPVPSVELKRRVVSYLEERKPAVVTLRVLPPYYIKADVFAELITTSIDAIPVIEIDAKRKISEFLHPLTGNAEKKGWSFGCALCVSDIYSILEHIKDVKYVNNVTITLYDDSGKGSNKKLSDECAKLKLPEYALPYSGEHEIKVIWIKNEKER